MVTETRQPYRSVAEALDPLYESLVEKGAAVDREADEMRLRAEYERARLNKERYNQLRDIAENYRHQAHAIDVARSICYSYGTAAETVTLAG